MFGWLSTRSVSLCRRAPRTVVSRRIRRITPHALISALPALGSVLYLHASSGAVASSVLPGLLIAQSEHMPLIEAHWLVAVSAVTDDGPREWCECVDRSGHTRARWHLLPDTDYLAWDALTASCVPNADFPLDVKPLRPDHACVMSFRLREFAGLLLFEQDISATLSPLGGHIATRIAQAESAVLQH